MVDNFPKATPTFRARETGQLQTDVSLIVTLLVHTRAPPPSRFLSLGGWLNRFTYPSSGGPCRDISGISWSPSETATGSIGPLGNVEVTSRVACIRNYARAGRGSSKFLPSS